MKNAMSFSQHNNQSCAASNDGFFTCNNNIKGIESTIIIIVLFLLALLVLILK